MSGLAYLAELAVIDAAGATVTVRLSTRPVRPFPPTDPDRPGARWAPRLVEPANVETDLYADMTRGVGGSGGGALVIANADGAHSWMAGRPVPSVTVWAGPAGGRAFGDFAPLFHGAGGVAEVEVSAGAPSRVTVTLSDARAVLDEDMPGETYAGTGQAEGGADLAGSRKPAGWGDLTTANVPLVPVDRAGLVWAGPAGGEVVRLYDRGGLAGLSHAGDYPGGLYAAAIAAGSYGTDSAAGLLRLGSAVPGPLTADVRVHPVGADTAPELLRRVLLACGEPPERIGPTFATLDAPAPCGLYVGTAGARPRELVDRLCASFLGWCVPDALGVWQVGRLTVPAGPPALDVGPSDYVDLAPDTWGYDTPICEARIGWGRNLRTMRESEVAGLVTEDADRMAYLAEEWRWSRWADDAVAALWGRRARRVEVQTALRYAADAAPLAAAWGALFGVPRSAWRIVLPLTAEVRALTHGDVLRVRAPLHGVDGLFRVVALRPTAPKMHLMTLRLWG